MMKKYDTNIKNGVATIKITLQSEEYKGIIVIDIQTNIKGLGLMNCIDDDFFWLDNIIKNDCNFTFSDEDSTFSCTLKDENLYEFEMDEYNILELSDYIVAIEILDYVEVKK